MLVSIHIILLEIHFFFLQAHISLYIMLIFTAYNVKCQQLMAFEHLTEKNSCSAELSMTIFHNLGACFPHSFFIGIQLYQLLFFSSLGRKSKMESAVTGNNSLLGEHLIFFNS